MAYEKNKKRGGSSNSENDGEKKRVPGIPNYDAKLL